jgi:DNA polymerase-1
VHDELNFNVPVAEVDKVRDIVVSEMQNVVHLTVPLIADCGIGTNWLQAH